MTKNWSQVSQGLCDAETSLSLLNNPDNCFNLSEHTKSSGYTLSENKRGGVELVCIDLLWDERAGKKLTTKTNWWMRRARLVTCVQRGGACWYRTMERGRGTERWKHTSLSHVRRTSRKLLTEKYAEREISTITHKEKQREMEKTQGTRGDRFTKQAVSGSSHAQYNIRTGNSDHFLKSLQKVFCLCVCAHRAVFAYVCY